MGNDEPRCEWCNDQGLIPIVHKDYTGDTPVIQEYTDRRTGEVKYYRWPGTMTAHCTMCGLGNWMRVQLDEKTRERIPTLDEVVAQKRNGRPFPYVLEASIPAYFASYAEGLAGLRDIKQVTGTFPDLPKAPKPQTAIDIANALRERAKREKQEEPAS